jgi:low affinity Fe/Cu permease
MSNDHIRMPSEVSTRIGFFDRFAGHAARLVSRAPFFAFCLILVLLWFVQGVVMVATTGKLGDFTKSSYQLEINTTTTIITFLMVAVLQNSQTREDLAMQHKLNAIADGLADLMRHFSLKEDDQDLAHDIEELRRAVGLEDIESTS